MVCAFGAAPAPEFAQQVPVLIAQPAPMMAWGPEAMFPPVGMPGSGYPQFCQPFVDGAAFPESPGNFMPGPGFGLMAEPAPGDWPESPMKVSPPEGLQSAVAAATAASNACGSACVPVAVRQVASGMWCVLVSDPNAQRDQSFTQQTGLMDMNGAESAMHLNLAEHLTVAEPSYAAGPVQLYGGTGPQQLSPRESDKRGEPPATPPPRARQEEVLPTPSPVSFRTRRLEDKPKRGQSQALVPAFPGPCGQEPLELAPILGWEPQTQAAKAVPKPKPGWERPVAGRARHLNLPAYPDRRKSWKKPHKPSAEDPEEDAVQALLSSTVWHVIEEVLTHRPQLEAGKRVTVSFPQWLNDMSCGDRKRAMVNRALRNMSKKLPGCCWTVNMENQDRRHAIPLPASLGLLVCLV